MIKKILFIILITNLYSSAALIFSEAKADFAEKIQASIKDLIVKSKLEKTDEMSYQYYFADTSSGRAIHAVDIGFTLKKKELPTIQFTQAKRTDLRKQIPTYFKEEMDMQWVVLNELASRMLIAPPLGQKDDRLFLNLMGDVRLKIEESYAEMKTDISFVDGNMVRMELYSEESMVCFFNIKISSVAKNKSKSEHFNETDYIMTVDMFLSQHNRQENKKVVIDMITEDAGLFDRKIQEILGHINLKQYVNNNNESISNMSDYLKNHLMNIKKTSNPNLKTDMTFDITFENQMAKGILKYIAPGPQDLTNLGDYNLKLIKDDEEVKSLDFKRMSTADFAKFMKDNEIEKIFKSMFEEIMEMFKRKYAETHKPEFATYNLSPVAKEASNSLFGASKNEKKGLSSKAGNNVLLEFLYEENLNDKHDTNPEVIVIFDAKNPMFRLSQSFKKMDYKKEVVSAWIDYICTHHIMLKKLLGTNSAKLLRLI